MKVLIVGPWSAPIIRRLSEVLAKAGLEVIIASHNISYLPQPKNERIIIENLGPLKGFYCYLKFWKIRALTKKYKPDLIHAHKVSHYGLMAVFSNKPVLLALWGSDIMISPNSGPFLKRLIFKIINWIVLKRATYIHTSAQHVLEEAANQCSFVSAKSHSFYWGLPVISGDEVSISIAKSNLKEDFNITSSEYFVFPRGLAPIYRPELTAKIIRILSEKGGGERSVVLRAFSSKEDEQKFLELVGKADFIYINRLLTDEELYVLYSKAKYHFSFPHSDSLGGGVVEPAQLGSTAILSKLPSYEFFVEKAGGLIIENESEQYLSELVEKLLIGKAYKGSKLNSFSADIVLDKLLDIYSTVIKSR